MVAWLINPLALHKILVKLIFLFLAVHAWAHQEATPEQYPRVPSRPGEYCTVGKVPLDSAQGDVALLVRGRRVPLHRTMVDSFMRMQEVYFAQKQPRGALFQEELEAPAHAALGGISSGWFIFGIYILLALIFGGLSGYAAVSKGLKPIPHFFIGFFLSAIGYLYVLTRPSMLKSGEVPGGLVKVPTTREPVPCAKCGYTNHPSARACAGCGTALQPRMESEVTRVR